MSNQTIIWSCWATSGLLSRSVNFTTPLWLPVNHNGRFKQTGIATYRNGQTLEMCEKTKPFTQQFSFFTAAGSPDDEQPHCEVCVPQHSLVITFPFGQEQFIKVSLRRPWPVMTSSTTCQASCIVSTDNKAVKVTTHSLQINSCHSVDLGTSVLFWRTIRKVITCDQNH